MSNEQATESSEVVLPIPLCSEDACPDCHLETDIIFQSEDGVRFAGHIELFQSYGGFPPSGLIRVSEIPETVLLKYHSSVLRLLLQFMHHTLPQPPIDHLPFSVLKDLAYASEMYMVYPAIGVCRLAMKGHIQYHALEIFRYAAQHDLRDMMDRAAPFLVDRNFREIRSDIGDQYGYAWLQYVDEWRYRKQMIWTSPEPQRLDHHKKASCPKVQWRNFYSQVIADLKRDNSLSTLPKAYNVVDNNIGLLYECRTYIRRAQILKSQLEEKGLFVPLFSSFLVRKISVYCK